MGTEANVPKRTSTHLIYIIHRFLTWICAITILVLLYLEMSSFNIKFILDIGINCSLEIFLLLSCIGAITRRTWGSHWIRVTGLWCMVLLWCYIPDQVQNTLWVFRYGIPIPSRANPMNLLLTLLAIFSLFALVTLSHILYEHQISIRNDSNKNAKHKIIKNASFIYIGISGILLGLALNQLNIKIGQQVYAYMLGSYFILAGSALLLAWHIRTKNIFLVGSTLSVSALLLIYWPNGPTLMRTLVRWLPPIVFGIVNLVQKTGRPRLPRITIAFPVLLMLVSICPLVTEYPRLTLNLQFTPYPYHKVTSERPKDFPEYLIAPEDATYVYYRGGKDAYMSFGVNDPYPATQTINFISEKLDKAGWKKLDYSIVNPQFPSSHLRGWRGFVNNGNMKDRSWCADWMNDKDETLSVYLTYWVPIDSNEELTTLGCKLYKYSSKWKGRKALDRYRRIRKENDPNL